MMSEEKEVVASLDADTQSPTPTKTEIDYEAKALSYLKRGMDKRKIMRRLMDDGLSRPEAVQLTTHIWAQGASTRRTNALILIVTACFMLGIGLLDFVPRVAQGEALPLFTVAYALLPLGMLVLVSGVLQWRDSRGA